MKLYKKMLGVTLLEIMLVLAVAAVVIVMSVRYYQAASTSEATNQAIEEIQAIAAAADNLAQNTGSYASISSTTIAAAMGGSASLYGPAGAITFGAFAASAYTATIPMGAAACAQVVQRVTNAKIIGTCTAGTGYVYTYNNAN